MSAQPGDTWYRYDFMRYAPPLDEYERPCGSGHREVVLTGYIVERVTPKGVWLEGRRFVLTSARKRFACPTKEEARESFIARKNRQVRILKAQLLDAELALQLIDKPDQRERLPMEFVTLPEEFSL